MQICTRKDSSAAQECDLMPHLVCGEAGGVWAASAALWAGLCLLQALTKIAASSLHQMALALQLGIPCLSYQCCAGLHIAVDAWSAAPKRRTLRQQLTSALCSQKLLGTLRDRIIMSHYGTYIADSIGHCTNTDQKVLILLYEDIQVCCKGLKILLKIVLESSHLHITSQFKVL